MSETQTPLAPEFQALLTRVQEIGKTNHENLIAENRKMMAEAIAQVGGGLKAPVAAESLPNGEDKAPALSPGFVARMAGETPPALRKGPVGFVARVLGWEKPHAVSKTRGEMLDEVRLGKLSPETLQTAEAGLQAAGIMAAFDRDIVVGPKRGFTAWQLVGIAAATTVVAGGAVAGGMYLAEVGPFAPKADAEPQPES